MKKFVTKHWGKIILLLVLVYLVVVNFKWGFYILGNDNYSPEVNPEISLKRFIFSPAWRSYRVVGVASDADQADMVRVVIFGLLGKILPLWFLGQGWVLFCLVFGVMSMAALTKYVGSRFLKIRSAEWLFLLGGVLYLSSLLTVWIFYSPLVPFMAVWSFLPYLMLSLSKWLTGEGSRVGVVLGVLLISICAIVPTIFIVTVLVVVVWLILMSWWIGGAGIWRRSIVVFGLFLASQLFWLLPFSYYVKTNAEALKNSYINRMLTPEMVESEIKYNSLLNVPRYITSWMDVKNNNGTWWFGDKEWFSNNKIIAVIGYLPMVMAAWGLIYVVFIKKKKAVGIGLGALFLSGWFLIKGVNWPFGGLYAWLQQNLPLFEQVFRWQSSKLWPLMTYGLVILAAIGVWKITDMVGKKVRMLVGVLVVGSLMYYVWPWFGGDLIRKGNYVKVPEEYTHLREFLGENNLEKERIYLAPEANTLYFRNYNWGFFGSSLVNYIIPNPIIEKALTTGSMEAESTQSVIQQAYYSQNKKVFANALAKYRANLVLMDTSASSKENGYIYDFDLLKNMVANNEFLEHIWQEGNLGLYRLKDKEEKVYEWVETGHDWQKMGMIDVFLGDSRKKVASDNQVGAIYPLSWKYEQVEIDSVYVRSKTEYKGVGGKYRLDWGEGGDDEEIPVLYEWDEVKQVVSLEPLFPKLKINGAEVSGSRAIKRKIMVSTRPRFVSVGTEVIDLADKKLWQTSLNRLKKKEIGFWPENSRLEKAKKGIEFRPYWVAGDDAIVRVGIRINSNESGQVNFCVWSENNQMCLSENITSVVGEGENQYVFDIDEVIQKGDKITFFVEPKEAGLEIVTEDVELMVFGRDKGDSSPDIKIMGDSDEIVDIKPGDIMELELPIISGHESWFIDNRAKVGPEVSNENCSGFTKDYLSESKVDFDGQGASFYAKNCWGGVYSKHNLVMPRGGLGMVAYVGENKSGIPLDIFIKSDKRDFTYYKERIAWREKRGSVDYVMLPEEWKSYYMEVFSQGIGPKESINRIESMVFQFIPREWLGMRLVPVKEELVVVTVNNEAKAPGWISEVGAEGVLVNGWEQGWLTKEGGYYYWPNILAWVGYGISLVVLIGFSFWPQKKLHGKV